MPDPIDAPQGLLFNDDIQRSRSLGARPVLLDRPRSDGPTWADVGGMLSTQALRDAISPGEGWQSGQVFPIASRVVDGREEFKAAVPQMGQDFVNGVLGLVDLVGDATSGDPARQQRVADLRRLPDKSLTSMLDVTGSGMAARPVPGVLHTFVGRRAAGAAPIIDAGERELLRGADRAEVHARHLVSRGPDGDMRLEIDDSQARINPQIWQRSLDLGADNPGKPHPGLLTTFGKAVEHPELLRMHPDMGDAQVRLYAGVDSLPDRPNSTGGYYPGNRGLLGTGLLARPDLYRLAGLTPDDVMPTVIHEGQHGVQYREGHSVGSSPDRPEVIEMGNRMRDREIAAIRREHEQESRLYDQLVARYRPTTRDDFTRLRREFEHQYPDEAKRLSEAEARIARHRGPEGDETFPLIAYQTVAGEAEAFAAERRRLMGQTERRATGPWSNYWYPYLLWDPKLGPLPNYNPK